MKYILEAVANISEEQLMQMYSILDDERKRRQKLRQADALEHIQQIAREHGIDLESFGRGSDVVYRDPENAFNTWSGRGRRPAWFTAALQRGLTKGDLRA